MLRFFSTQLAFGVKSTATNILLLIKDLYRDNRVVQRYPYPGSKQYDSNNIIDKDLLVTRLSSIILETIDYEQYKKLPINEKNKIEMSIARSLYLESANYESSYYVDDESPWGNSRDLIKTKGISFSLCITQYPIDEAYEVNFPKDLFLNKRLIIDCICEAFDQHPHILKKNRNAYLHLTYNL